MSESVTQELATARTSMQEIRQDMSAIRVTRRSCLIQKKHLLRLLSNLFSRIISFFQTYPFRIQGPPLELASKCNRAMASISWSACMTGSRHFWRTGCGMRAKQPCCCNNSGIVVGIMLLLNCCCCCCGLPRLRLLDEFLRFRDDADDEFFVSLLLLSRRVAR